MWPKALLDLAPHLIRFVPAANRFLQDRSGSDQAARESIEALNSTVRSELGRITAAHSGMYRQLNDQAEKVDRLTTDLAAAKLAVESSEGRLARLQRRINTMMKMLVASLIMMFLLLLMVFALLFKH